MTQIHYHPGEELLLDHYHGRLGEGPALLVATHLGLCAHCRGFSALFETIGAAMLEDVTSVDMSDEALDRHGPYRAAL
jgi:putative transcriptional regulator